MTRFALALVVSLALTVGARAADLPTGTWAVNVDGNKGDLVIKEVKDGRTVTGVLLGTDFTGGWNGKTLVFAVNELRYEAHLVTEPDENGKTKYTLTGTRTETKRVDTRVAIHRTTTGWYAQMSAVAPKYGEIRATVRGVLTTEVNTAYVSVKPDANTPELRVWFRATDDQWNALRNTLKELNGKEVVVTGKLGQPTKPAVNAGAGALYFLDLPEIKPATK
jgi:hypothetical protein